MAQMLVVYYSRSGNTEAMAHCVAEAADEIEGVEVALRSVDLVTPDDLLRYDAIAIGSPVYYGTMAAEIKRLLDESVVNHGKLDGKVGAAFASSGGLAGGNETTVVDILRCLLIHGMIIKGDAAGDHYGPVSVGVPDERSEAECRKLGRNTARLALRLFG